MRAFFALATVVLVGGTLAACGLVEGLDSYSEGDCNGGDCDAGDDGAAIADQTTAPDSGGRRGGRRQHRDATDLRWIHWLRGRVRQPDVRQRGLHGRVRHGRHEVLEQRRRDLRVGRPVGDAGDVHGADVPRGGLQRDVRSDPGAVHRQHAGRRAAQPGPGPAGPRARARRAPPVCARGRARQARRSASGISSRRAARRGAGRPRRRAPATRRPAWTAPAWRAPPRRPSARATATRRAAPAGAGASPSRASTRRASTGCAPACARRARPSAP